MTLQSTTSTINPTVTCVQTEEEGWGRQRKRGTESRRRQWSLIKPGRAGKGRERLLAATVATLHCFKLMAAVSGRPARAKRGFPHGSWSRLSVLVAPWAKSGGPGHFVPCELNGLKFTLGHLCNIMTTQLRLSYHIHI